MRLLGPHWIGLVNTYLWMIRSRRHLRLATHPAGKLCCARRSPAHRGSGCSLLPLIRASASRNSCRWATRPTSVATTCCLRWLMTRCTHVIGYVPRVDRRSAAFRANRPPGGRSANRSWFSSPDAPRRAVELGKRIWPRLHPPMPLSTRSFSGSGVLRMELDGRTARRRPRPDHAAAAGRTAHRHRRQLRGPGDPGRRRRGRGRARRHRVRRRHPRGPGAGRRVRAEPDRPRRGGPARRPSPPSCRPSRPAPTSTRSSPSSPTSPSPTARPSGAAVIAAAAASGKPTVAVEVGAAARTVADPGDDAGRCRSSPSRRPPPRRSASPTATPASTISAIELPVRPAGVDPMTARALVTAALSAGGGWLAPDQVDVLLSCYGIPRCPQRIVHSGDDAVQAAARVRLPGRAQAGRGRPAQDRPRRGPARPRQRRRPARGRRPSCSASTAGPACSSSRW